MQLHKDVSVCNSDDRCLYLFMNNNIEEIQYSDIFVGTMKGNTLKFRLPAMRWSVPSVFVWRSGVAEVLMSAARRSAFNFFNKITNNT